MSVLYDIYFTLSKRINFVVIFNIFSLKPPTPPRLAPLQRSHSAEEMRQKVGSACGNQCHPSAGQELCYLCHQRARRNIPVSFTEERKRREEEEDRLLQQYQTMRDAEDILKEQVSKQSLLWRFCEKIRVISKDMWDTNYEGSEGQLLKFEFKEATIINVIDFPHFKTNLTIEENVIASLVFLSRSILTPETWKFECLTASLSWISLLFLSKIVDIFFLLKK